MLLQPAGAIGASGLFFVIIEFEFRRKAPKVGWMRNGREFPIASKEQARLISVAA
jgi:hypothetical protein